MRKNVLITLFCTFAIIGLWGYFYKKYKVNEPYPYMNVFTLNYTDLTIKELEKRVVEDNDRKAYDQLLYSDNTTDYIYDSDKNKSLFYSLLMANTCHYPSAYYDVYNLLDSYEYYCNCKVVNNHLVHEKSPFSFDKVTRQFMIDNLKKGAALGDMQANKCLGELYLEGKYLPKDTVLGKMLIKKSGY
ncbi:hypothetical protein [uncultured Bacteroides sp.]|uniref:hypothetical protein n=1 Tax=uncultured Bacteroides sp. TaxID=162156 RepID=UPI002AAAFCB0|nr:hypothetical protein [uncultured Bacteroides sp.]